MACEKRNEIDTARYQQYSEDSADNIIDYKWFVHETGEALASESTHDFLPGAADIFRQYKTP